MLLKPQLIRETSYLLSLYLGLVLNDIEPVCSVWSFNYLRYVKPVEKLGISSTQKMWDFLIVPRKPCIWWAACVDNPTCFTHVSRRDTWTRCVCFYRNSPRSHKATHHGVSLQSPYVPSGSIRFQHLAVI